MTIPADDDLSVSLAADDARNAQAAGIKFARSLVSVYSADFALALAEQEELIRRAILEAGHNAEQAQLAAAHFEAAAQDEWQRIAASGGSEAWGQA